jgi:hypothetical protein
MKKWTRHPRALILAEIHKLLAENFTKRSICKRVAAEFDLTYERVRQIRASCVLVVDDDSSPVL